jgi:chaperone BCS1
MNTIVLEYEQKEHVLADINEYLRPATRRWYTNRGIPYRRGYLLHGPPGTGKTSLSFAIAGLFGLDIYCISLLEPTLTEEDLGLLFNNLPSRCVVLLEDIDSAGLIRSNESKADAADTEPIKTDVATEIAKAFETNAKNKNKTQGISLSGLLNTIDGVASHEGRVLVMTTNYPEKLDKALIRPGRIDVKVGFTLASQKQARELFTRIYSADRLNEAAVKLANNTITPSAASNEKPGEEVNVDEIARQFAEKIPADTFTPAAIQGFLLMHKKNPHGALEKVAEWKKSQAKSS